MTTEPKDKNSENELDVHYVNVEEEKEQSLVLPLISFLLGLFSFLFYPFQLIAILFSFFTIYMTRNHAMKYKPFTIIALILALIGFIIGMSGVNIIDGMQPVFKEMKYGVSCDGLDISIVEACYDAENKQIHTVLIPNKDIHRLTLSINSTESVYLSETKEGFFEGRISTMDLSFDGEALGTPTSIKLVSVLKSYLERRLFSCLDNAQTIPLELCS